MLSLMTPEGSSAFPIVSANNKIVFFSIYIPHAMSAENQNNLYHHAVYCSKQKLPKKSQQGKHTGKSSASDFESSTRRFCLLSSTVRIPYTPADSLLHPLSSAVSAWRSLIEKPVTGIQERCENKYGNFSSVFRFSKSRQCTCAVRCGSLHSARFRLYIFQGRLAAHKFLRCLQAELSHSSQAVTLETRLYVNCPHEAVPYILDL